MDIEDLVMAGSRQRYIHDQESWYIPFHLIFIQSIIISPWPQDVPILLGSRDEVRS